MRWYLILLAGIIGFGLIWGFTMLSVVSLTSIVPTLNKIIEKSVGVETVTVGELKEMAEKGIIPYEVYRLALYEKLKNPKVFFKYAFGKVYIFENGWNRLLQGRYIEKINDTWYRVVIVLYDDLFTKKYISIKVYVCTKLRSGYIVNYWQPSYIKFLERKKGTWEYIDPPNTHYKGTIVVLVYKNPNPEDARIAKEIAEQLMKFGEEHGLTKMQLMLIVCEELTRTAMKYLYNNDWIGRPFTVKVLDGEELCDLHVNKSDSLLKTFVLYGRGSCYVQSLLTIYVLNSLGIKACEFDYDEHAVVVIPYTSLNVKELKDLGMLGERLTLDLGNGKEYWAIYDVVHSESYRTVIHIPKNETKTTYLVIYKIKEN